MFHLQKLTNIKPAHVTEFVKLRLQQNKAAATIKRDLSAIRYFIDQYPGIYKPHTFPTNKDIGELLGKALPKRVFQHIDRAWAVREYKALVKLAFAMNRPIVGYFLTLGYALGLRIHEVPQIDHARMIAALKQDFIMIKGKNGLWRQVPLTSLAIRTFKKVLKDTPRGQRAFIERGKKVHQQIESVQHWIANHRSEVEEDYRQAERRDGAYLKEIGAEGYKTHITFHGLRHLYARQRYTEFKQKGMSPREARKGVSELLGHERDEVTKIYLDVHED